MQGEFQRTFLMMRPLDAQDSASTGFIRMERKGNRGKILFHAQGLQKGDDLHAVIYSQDGRESRVIPCGTMQMDSRGQGKLEYTVDNLTSSALSAYRAVAILREEEGRVKMAMAGMFGKGKPLDREKIEAMAIQALGLLRGSAQEQAREANESGQAHVANERGQMQGQAPRQELAQESGHTTPPVIVTQPGSVTAPVIITVPESVPLQDAARLPENIWSVIPEEPGNMPALGVPEELEGIEWPDGVLPLRELFERFEVVAPVTGMENEVFVMIPMSGGLLGIDHYLLGVRVEASTVRAVGYAIPGAGDTPPVGLNGYIWADTPLGGYWIKWEKVA